VIRKIGAENYLSVFLIAAVTTILLIRLFLKITGYPQLGGAAGLHIAHMLWGGLLMLAAIVIAFSFVGRGPLQWVAVLGGIGFGAFIDELGKFITHDNNYFFQPTIALIYFIFILIFLTVRALVVKEEFLEKEYLINALEELEEAALNDLDLEGKKRTLQYLSKCNPKDPFATALIRYFERMNPAPVRKPNAFVKAKQKLRVMYSRMIRLPGFSTGIILLFLVQLMVTLATAIILIFLRGLGMEQILDTRVIGKIAQKLTDLSFIDWAHLASSWLSTIFVFWGIIRIRKSRLAAYRMFERSMLVAIFLTQFFAFYKEQFSALAGLFINILIWAALRYMIGQELLRKAPIERQV